MAKPSVVEKYPITESFERAIVLMCCSRPSFWGRVGEAIEAAAVPSPSGALLVQACAAIAKERGRGPTDLLLPLQRLRTWMDEGKVTHDQLVMAEQYLETAEDMGVPAEEAIVGELLPILKQRMSFQATSLHVKTHTARGDTDGVIEMLTRIKSLGSNDMSIGDKLCSANFDVVRELRVNERLSTGIYELDMVLDGGFPPGHMTFYIGDPGAGKSMVLVQQVAASMIAGEPVCLATLEVSQALQFARVVSNLTNVPIDMVVQDSPQARERFEQLNVAPCFIKYFTPQGTSFDEIREWVGRCEEHLGAPIRTTVVDYLDKCVARGSGGKDKNGSEYFSMRQVYEAARVWNHERNGWLVSASQAKVATTKEKGKRKDIDSASDSAHKQRVADIVITLNGNDDNSEVYYFIGKHRTGKSRLKVGPLPTDFGYAQISPVVRDFKKMSNAPGGHALVERQPGEEG